MTKTAEMLDATHKRHASAVIELPSGDDCRHELIDDGLFTLVCVHCDHTETHEPEGDDDEQ